MHIKKAAIIGKGAVGLLYGSLIARNIGPGAVEYVMDDDRLARHVEDAVTINGSPCRIRTVGASIAAEEGPVDLLILAIKATGLEQTVFTKEAFDMSRSLARSIHASDAPAVGTARRGQNWGFYNWLFSREMDRSHLYGEFGHRYNQVVCLAVAARKNRVPFSKLEADVKSLYHSWNECSKTYGHPPIKWSECAKAMKVYNQKGDVEKFPRWWLEEKCGFEFGHQKRNGLTQAEHLANVHRRRRLDSMMRLSEYLSGHPDATKNAACRDLGMSKSTVCRHWRMACAAAGIEDTRSL